MKWIAKILLWIIGVAIPVVIAACYGMPYKFSKTGKVVDAETKAGIDGIQVTCVQGGQDEDVAFTYSGDFTLWYDIPCDTLQIKDVDGAQNGEYQDREIEFCESCDTLSIELLKKG
jgi:hypothetical protein